MKIKMIFLWLWRFLLGSKPAKPLEDQIMDKYLQHPMLDRCKHFETRLEFWQRYWTGRGKSDLEVFARIINEFLGS